MYCVDYYQWKGQYFLIMFRLLNYFLFEKEILELKSMKISDKSVTLKLLAFFF